jgi:hypothetical protein
MVVLAKNAYASAFYFLDYLLKENFVQASQPLDIVSLISDMDLFIWAPDANGYYRSSDLGMGQEWKKILFAQGIEVNQEISPEKAFSIMIEFLEQHEKNYDFKLKSEIAFLHEIKGNIKKYQKLWDYWLVCLSHSQDYPIKVE